MVSVVIPAYNEERTIGRVVKAVKSHKWVQEVIVVDDGSKDNTAGEAKKSGAKVIKLPKNKGKAAALNHGVANAKNDLLCFLDADIENINDQMLTKIIKPVKSGEYSMFVGICGRKKELNKFLTALPVLSGQRVLTKQLWNLVPSNYKKDFQIEIALNYYAKINEKKMGVIVLEELDHVAKEKKYGVVSGFLKRIEMYKDFLHVSFMLYVYETIKRKLL